MKGSSLRTILGVGAVVMPPLAAAGLLLAWALQRPSAEALGAAAIAGGAVAVGLGAALRRALLLQLDAMLCAQAAESLRFDTAINKISQGLCFFDGEQRLIVCNARYAEIYSLSPTLMKPGMTLREIVDARYAAGSYPDMTPAEYMAWRVSISIIAKASSLSSLPSARRPRPDSPSGHALFVQRGRRAAASFPPRAPCWRKLWVSNCQFSR